MKCVLCEIDIQPYEPGTVLVETVDDELEPSNGVWHETCYKQYREDYRTSDEIIAESE